MVASHNKDTVKFTLGRMADLGIHPSENKIYFGQLLGMCDQITFPLAALTLGLLGQRPQLGQVADASLLADRILLRPVPGWHSFSEPGGLARGPECSSYSSIMHLCGTCPLPSPRFDTRDSGLPSDGVQNRLLRMPFVTRLLFHLSFSGMKMAVSIKLFPE
ncbi:putative Proline dehydrogenase protein, partial [Naja naja]